MDNVAATSAPSHWLLRRILRGLMAFVVALALAGMIYQNIFEARDIRFNPMPGRRFDVGGYKMHIDCTGEGTPTVILDSGLGDSYISWRNVQPQIAKFTRVCSYDRAGIGFSDSSSQPRTSRVIAGELHALLRAAGVAPPYMLVGHSHPDQENRLPRELKDMEGSWRREAEFMEYTMPFGIPRLFRFCDEDPVARAAECNWHTAAESVAELKAFPESAAQTASTGSLGDMPLAVLSHDPDKPSAELPADIAKTTNDAWEKMQEELARLSTRGTQVIAKNSAHYIQIDRPDVVIDAVRSVVGQVRGAQPAAPSKAN